MASSNSKHHKIVYVGIWIPGTAPENDDLYRPVLDSDPAIQNLAKSIREIGLREPLVLSSDNYIISGHRRFAACKLAGLKEVPVRYESVCRRTERDKFLTLLREHNRQRVKSLDEQIREAVIDANPEEARAELIEYRCEKSRVGHDSLSLGAVRTRKKISPPKFAFQQAIIDVVDERRDFWPLSDRQIHYALLNNPPLKHSGKSASIYKNDKASYKSLVDLVTRMRIAGVIPFEAIGDETRPFTKWDVHREPGAFVTKEVNDFLKGYYRDLIQSQPNHIEVVVEKNTVAGILRPVCGEFCIPMTSGRGYCSLPPRYEMATRFEQSGKGNLIVVLVSDFDPDGEEIAKSFGRSMRDDFGVDNVVPIKVALTADQASEYKLPPSMEAKESSSRAKGFVAQYGKSVWELEALPPATLQSIVRQAIVGVLDMDLFQKEQLAEQRDAVSLKAIRETMQDALKDVRVDTEGGVE